jgi:hypothetical protein
MSNPNHIILVRPANFGFNFETAGSNKFQQTATIDQAQEKAVAEFDRMVEQLRSQNIVCTVFQDTEDPIKPDAIFPNNWISVQPNGTLAIYPMEAENRRLERRRDIVDFLISKGFSPVFDYSSFEKQGQIVEGTGSILFDHENNLAFGCISSRTDAKLFEQIVSELGYKPISFLAEDLNGHPIYHTNVMLAIGEHTIVCCAESISNPIERQMVTEQLKSAGKVYVEISLSQMNQFAGNCLEVNDKTGKPKLILSQTALDALHTEQINSLQNAVELVPVEIPTIEKIGGGSARCMCLGICELHL